MQWTGEESCTEATTQTKQCITTEASTQTDQVDDVETSRQSSDEETDYAPREAFIGESAQPEPLRCHVSTIICNQTCENQPCECN